jgi:hypothetical protein
MRAIALSTHLPRLDPADLRAALRFRPAATLLLACALAGDAAFVLLHIAHSATGFLGEDALVYQDGGYAEWFQYLKYASVLAMTLYLFARSGNTAYITLAVVAAFLLVDDSLMLHEHGGDEIGAALPFDSLGGLRAEDFGELAVYASFGAVFLVAAIAGHLRQDVEGRRFLLGFYAIVVALAFFAVGMDMVRMIGEDVLPGLGLIEDGGEMVVTSVLLVFVFERFLAAARSGPPPAPDPRG